MILSPEIWHNRYHEQARWTQPARQFLFDKVDLAHRKNILEVGCGTGAILEDVSGMPGHSLFGLDISIENLAFARRIIPGALFAQGDAHCLPFPSNYFDIIYTHYVLLWLDDPVRAITEMRRVAKRGAYVLALAEPDYGGRIDNPPGLGKLGIWQTASLKQQGAHPQIGRMLGELFLKAGLIDVYSGVLGGEWSHSPAIRDDHGEWEIMQYDLQALPDTPTRGEIQRLKGLDTQARQSGIRVLFVPTFYASGRVPE